MEGNWPLLCKVKVEGNLICCKNIHLWRHSQEKCRLLYLHTQKVCGWRCLAVQLARGNLQLSFWVLTFSEEFAEAPISFFYFFLHRTDSQKKCLRYLYLKFGISLVFFRRPKLIFPCQRLSHYHWLDNITYVVQFCYNKWRFIGWKLTNFANQWKRRIRVKPCCY